jgi:hypothetical protein
VLQQHKAEEAVMTIIYLLFIILIFYPVSLTALINVFRQKQMGDRAGVGRPEAILFLIYYALLIVLVILPLALSSLKWQLLILPLVIVFVNSAICSRTVERILEDSTKMDNSKIVDMMFKRVKKDINI